MDHSRAPVLQALQEFRRRGDLVYGPPGHTQGRGADPRVVEVVGEGVFASDVLSLNGLDHRRESQGITSQAEDLMADAVDADLPRARLMTAEGASQRAAASEERAEARNRAGVVA